MRTQDALARLAEHQDVIEREVELTGRLIDAGPETLHQVQRLRWELTRLLRGYQLFKHNELFDPAIASAQLADASLARILKARCIAAGDAFRRYTLKWSNRDLTGEWLEFGRAWHDMAGKLRDHLAHERREIARSLERVEDTRRRA